MEAAKRVAKNTGILYAQMGITVFISLYTTRLVLAALGASDFGLFNVVGGAIAMLTFLNTAMASASQRFMSFAQGEGNNEKQKSIFNISIVLHFIIAIAVVILLQIVGYFLFNGILKIEPHRILIAKFIYQFLIASTFFTIIAVPYDAVINAHENMLFVALLRIFESIIKLAIAFYITYTAFDKLYTYGLLMAVLTILLLLIRQIYCHLKYTEVELGIKKYFDKNLYTEMRSFAGWSLLGSSSGMLANYGQGIVINMFFGTNVNAAQGIAGQISGQLGVFAVTLLKALNPFITKSEGAGKRETMIKATLLGSKLSFFLLILLYVPFIVEMPFIFNIWLKEVPEYAIIFCRLLLLRNIIEQLFIPLSGSIGAVGKIKKFQTIISIVNFFPLIVTYVFFIYNYPPYFLYIVFIFYSIVNGIIVLYFSKITFELPLKNFFKDVLFRCISVFGLLLAIAYSTKIFFYEGFLRLTIVTIFSTLFFFLFSWYIGLTLNEKLFIRSVFIKNIFVSRKIKG